MPTLEVRIDENGLLAEHPEATIESAAGGMMYRVSVKITTLLGKIIIGNVHSDGFTCSIPESADMQKLQQWIDEQRPSMPAWVTAEIVE